MVLGSVLSTAGSSLIQNYGDTLTLLELLKNYVTLAMSSIDADIEAIIIPGWGTGCPGSGQRIDPHQTVHHRPGQ